MGIAGLAALAHGTTDGDLFFEQQIEAAAALSECTDRRLTMIEETRLGLLIRVETNSRVSIADVMQALRASRAGQIDCESAAVQEAIEAFRNGTLPELQQPILR